MTTETKKPVTTPTWDKKEKDAIAEYGCELLLENAAHEELKKYRDDSLTAILIWNFDSSVISAVPDGQVPYKENEVPIGTDHTSLRREWKNLFHFIKGGNDSLSALRRETMFIQMLEGLHPDEAKIICLVKDKNLTERYKITKDMVAEAFPDIRWSDRT